MDELVPGPPAQLLDAAAAYEAEPHPELTYDSAADLIGGILLARPEVLTSHPPDLFQANEHSSPALKLWLVPARPADS